MSKKLGSLESKLKRLGLDIFLNFLTLKTFQSNKPLKKARPFSSLVILMRVKVNATANTCMQWEFSFSRVASVDIISVAEIICCNSTVNNIKKNNHILYICRTGVHGPNQVAPLTRKTEYGKQLFYHIHIKENIYLQNIL